MNSGLAIDGGTPVRSDMLPYARQCVDEADVAAVVESLRSDWLTTGPRVAAFESAFAARAGAAHAVAVSSGTAALHAALHAAGVGPGDEVILPPLTFAATATTVLYSGATPVFADVDPQTLLLDPAAAAALVTSRTRAVIGVDYAGQPCDYSALAQSGLRCIADACHALGAAEAARPVGALATLSCFSLHPTKLVTAGEGGVVTTDDAALAERARRFRNHGISADHRARAAQGTWRYEITEPGLNYRLSDLQCALATSQLDKLERFVARRRAIAARYDAALAELGLATPLARRPGTTHAYHLYVVRLELERLQVDRAAVFAALRAEGIGAAVHYIPVHLQPLYRERLGTAPGLCPVAEAAYERILTLPLYPAMTDGDVDDVIAALDKVLIAYARS